MQVFGDSISGNCLKIKYTADYLERRYQWHEVNLLAGETRTPEFLAMNPAGQVPVLLLEDGRPLAQSNAIITYLAEGTRLLPTDQYERALVNQWLFWEQYSHEPYIAVLRFHVKYQGKPVAQRDPVLIERGEKALDLMASWLEHRRWFVGENMTIADISLLAYTRLAHEGGFDLRGRPAINQWILACEQELGI